MEERPAFPMSGDVSSQAPVDERDDKAANATPSTVDQFKSGPLEASPDESVLLRDEDGPHPAPPMENDDVHLPSAPPPVEAVQSSLSALDDGPVPADFAAPDRIANDLTQVLNAAATEPSSSNTLVSAPPDEGDHDLLPESQTALAADESIEPPSDSAPSTSFEFPADDSSAIDWMNAASPLESAGHEPVTAVGPLATQPLLEQSTDPSDSNHLASDDTQQHFTDDLEINDAHPVQVQSPFATQEPFGQASDEQAEAPDTSTSMPWDVAEGDNINNNAQSDSTLPWHATDDEIADSQHSPKLPWDSEQVSQSPAAADLWAQELATSHATHHEPLSQNHDPINDQSSLEDSWAKVFADPDSGLDDTWNAAFATGIDDEGFLEDAPVSTLSLPAAAPYVPSNQPTVSTTTAAPFPPRRTSSTNAPTSPYAAAPPAAAANVHQQSTPSGPMQFFAELPTQPVRSRKPRPQAPSPSQSSVPPPRNQAPYRDPVPPPAVPSTFRQPERMEMFPAQPSVPVASPQLSSPGFAEPPPLQKSQSASRYSPAPQPLASASTQRPIASNSSRYTSAPTQMPPSSSMQTAPPPPQAAAASKYSHAPPTATHPTRRSSFVHPPSSSVPEAPSPPQPGPPAVPASTTSAAAPATSSRGPPPGPPPNPFAPRTSSPLAHSGFRSIDGQSASASRTSQLPSAAARYSPAPMAQPSQPTPLSPPANGDSFPPSMSAQDSHRSANNLPPTAALHRAQTSSPKSFQASNTERSRSHDPSLVPTRAVDNPIVVPPQIHSQPHGETEFLLPTDETSHDPLERWKGCAIFCWGPGGLAISSVPKHVPRYGGGQSAPKIKPVAGEVKIQRTKDLLSAKDQLPPLPGPLKTKAKKKELISWLSSAVTLFEQQLQDGIFDQSLSLQLEEKIILWKILRVLVENDGVLIGNQPAESAAREALIQGLKSDDTADGGITNPPTGQPSDPSNAHAETIKRLLLEGNREKAVWHAVDNQLWAHALLLSVTALPAVWKQVVQEFVRKEVRNTGQNLQSMAALYQVIAGNWDDSIDELVPLSARSGFQMISTASSSVQARDAFAGLNKWRETLSLMFSNGGPDDGNAIVALGKLLAGSGRIEAAHVCFLFARGQAVFGGADDPNTNFSLLGVAHANLWSGSAVDLQAIQLTEAYEFALALNSANSSYYAPHLQAYKLHHALSLAESGSRGDALQYCEAIAAAMRSTTRHSPYCHAILASQLDDLQRRLSQSPKDGTSSWIPKPTMSKMSSSMGTWFNSFVAGDDGDTASTGSGPQSEQEVGPFAHIPGNTPIVSRSTSIADLSGAANYSASTSHAQGKYAPSNQAAHRGGFGDEGSNFAIGSPYSASPEVNRSSYSPRQSNDGFAHAYGSPPKPANLTRYSAQLSHPHSYSPMARSDSSMSRPSYEPYVPAVPEEPVSDLTTPASSGYPVNTTQSSDGNTSLITEKTNGLAPTNGYGPSSSVLNSASGLGVGASGGYAPTQDYGAFQGYQEENSHEIQHSSYEPPSGGYEPSSNSYAPPSDNYATSSYQPYEAETPQQYQDNEQKKPSMMDDADDDLAAKAAEIKRQERAAADRAADEAFRAAAEADAARDKSGGDKRSSSGWFSGIGGLFGGGGAKKDLNAPTVHRAKLGEENSFYFDKELNKWVNRKAGSSSPGSVSGTATPPPPPKASAPPSRNISTATGPPPTSVPLASDVALKPPSSSINMQDAASGPPSRVGTPGSVAGSTASGTMQPELGSSGPPVGSSGNTGPPSQAGPPSGPPSRPPTSMSDANSIDDLIGGPQARKGGTIKKGKKGQRYVDVMAK